MQRGFLVGRSLHISNYCVEGTALSGMHGDGVGGRDLEAGSPHGDPFLLYLDAKESVRWAYLKESTAI